LRVRKGNVGEQTSRPKVEKASLLGGVREGETTDEKKNVLSLKKIDKMGTPDPTIEGGGKKSKKGNGFQTWEKTKKRVTTLVR